MKKDDAQMYRFDLTRSGKPCQECGQTEAGGPCYPYRTHANLCHTYNSSQLRKMDALKKEMKLKKDKCCCGGTKKTPCVCMIEGNQCSASSPKCPCYALIDKQKNIKKMVGVF